MKQALVAYIPTVVPAECMLYFNPDFFISLCTSAICADTDAVGVPMGIKQKSAVALAGVERVEISMSDILSEESSESIKCLCTDDWLVRFVGY